MISLPSAKPDKPPFFLRITGPVLNPPRFPSDHYRDVRPAIIQQIADAMIHGGRVIVVVDDDVFRHALLNGSLSAKEDSIGNVVLSSYKLPGDAAIACERYLDLVADRPADADTMRKLDVAFELAYDR